MNIAKLRTVEDWVALYRHEFALPVAERGGFVMLPTGLGRWTREGCHWIVPPTPVAPPPAHELPPLSVVITTALAVGGGED